MSLLLLGPWLWYADPETGSGHWGGPPDLRGSLDLASLAQIVAARPGQPRGTGLFLCDSATLRLADYEALGYTFLSSEDLRDARPDAKLLDAWESITGYRPGGDTLAACLLDHRTGGADPANLDQPFPCIPGTRQELGVWFAGAQVAFRQFVFGTDPHTAKVSACLKLQLAAIREASLRGERIDPLTKQIDLDSHLKYADKLCEDYVGGNRQAKEEWFATVRPADWPAGEKPQRHATDITDNFTRADGTTIGNLLTWAEVAGDWTTASNAVIGPTTDSTARAESDLSSTNVYAQISAVQIRPATTRYGGAAARFDNGANTAYLLRLFGNASDATGAGNFIRVFRAAKIVTGTITALGTGTNQTTTLPKPIKITCGEGSNDTLTLYYDGASVESFTDSSITTGTRCGMCQNGGGATPSTLDDFAAGDLAAAVARHDLLLLGVGT